MKRNIKKTKIRHIVKSTSNNIYSHLTKFQQFSKIVHLHFDNEEELSDVKTIEEYIEKCNTENLHNLMIKLGISDRLVTWIYYQYSLIFDKDIWEYKNMFLLHKYFQKFINGEISHYLFGKARRLITTGSGNKSFINYSRLHTSNFESKVFYLHYCKDLIETYWESRVTLKPNGDFFIDDDVSLEAINNILKSFERELKS